MENEVLIYANNITTRLRYVLDFIFNDFLQIEYGLTQDFQRFLSYEGFKLTYGKELKDVPCVFSENILMDGFFQSLSPKAFVLGNTQAIFKNPNEAGYDFDIFSAIFFQLSRWEEFNDEVSERDEHHRYTGKSGWYQQNEAFIPPFVNMWIWHFAQYINGYFPELTFKAPNFKWVPTFDIDFGYQYKGKGGLRTIGASLKSFLKFDFKSISNRVKVLLGFTKDPYDFYGSLEQCLKGRRAYVFLLLTSFSKYNRGILPSQKWVKKLVSDIQQYAHAQVGIHPSYNSFNDTGKLIKETRLLSKSIGNVEHARMHFLQFEWLETQQNLTKAGVKHDYSMGYAHVAGYRAGTNIPFKAYDLELDEILPLTIHPLAVMDGTLSDYLKLTPEQAIEELKQMVLLTQKFGGPFVTLWHDHTMAKNSPWRKVFEELSQFVDNQE